ncbi:MAG: lysoplasmalogenase [Chitinophagales bacterium]|nr:lysoplasmalogenase [Chitinophagales bacterium]
MIWILYIAVCIFHLWTIFTQQATLTYWSKPLLMPILMLIVWKSTQLKTIYSKYLFWGVFCGWLGDMFLQGQGVLFFIFGLLSFLVGHLFYIALYSFEVQKLRATHFIMEQPYLIIPFLAFWIYIIMLLSPQESEFPKAPIYLYAFIIIIMLIMAINRKYAATKISWILVIVGSFLFVISDFSIAIQLFFGKFAFGRIFTMSTYLTAQGLIVLGVIKNKSLQLS